GGGSGRLRRCSRFSRSVRSGVAGTEAVFSRRCPRSSPAPAASPPRDEVSWRPARSRWGTRPAPGHGRPMIPRAPEVPAEFVAAVRTLRRDFPEAAPRYRLPLSLNTFGDLEVAAALETLVRGPLTQGPRVAAFEAEFAGAHGRPDAVFCNSGSSANLLALA